MTPSEVKDIAERFLFSDWDNPRGHKFVWLSPRRFVKADRSGAYWEIRYRMEPQKKDADEIHVSLRPIVVDEDSGEVFFR